MSLKDIKATFSCDGCGATMVAEIDPTWPLCGDTAFDMAQDALKGGCGPGLVLCSTDYGKDLCKACTAAADAEHLDDIEERP